MRRSKSDPAKYARNYRKISQRRMTQYDHLDEDQEIERLRNVLRNSEAHLQKATEQEEEENAQRKNKDNKRKRGGADSSGSTLQDSTCQMDHAAILSDELIQEGTSIENPLIVLPSKKKKKKQKPTVVLTPEEIKEAKSIQKKTARKLQQLETRAAQKKKRAELYKKLEEHKISKQASMLLTSSGKLSRKNSDTKRQSLQKLLNKERAGLELTGEESELLYPERVVQEPDQMPPIITMPIKDTTQGIEKPNESKQRRKKRSRKATDQTKMEDGDDSHIESDKNKIVPDDSTTFKSTAKTPASKQSETSSDDDDSFMETNEVTIPAPSAECEKEEAGDKKENASTQSNTATGFNFAAQMMASLSKLKQQTDQKAEEDAANKDEDDESDIPTHPSKRYVPDEPTVLKTAASLGLKGSTKNEEFRRVMQIKRPEPIEKARYDLPVSGMEFEIMDAIRNNYVTIICGETGSGKSTQVPQFLYESGFSVSENDPEKKFLVGITQPRRVAAVSTAKRVCYEMGHGDGQSIISKGSKGGLVAYKTRYETAGVGKETAVQFMTDGILLQEIQSDLLLRRYSVIVLDEAHERNLNTDVLIGLLSVALPLRKKAAEEDPSIVPLKLVLMSATLRVDDFTKNQKLFPMGVPAVVNVPGRAHPVTIHHSKVTELDDYEQPALKKICKIHRKLPQGGILVFLTGKGEIIRMVNRLRKTLCRNPSSRQKRYTGDNDVNNGAIDDVDAPRELDDEELDAEDIVDEYEELAEDDDDVQAPSPEESDGDDAIPKNALILPLYSLLSAEEQAKVFAPVPDGTRLIVVATNIAETSITIPGISYVVDTGRQKCRNYNSGTGVASYDIMWISKAAADQRAGRAGRTGPGHCYRLYSSSLYSRHMDPFALPEVLTRPLEDVILAMKALKVTNVSDFPFPTPPDKGQIQAAVRLLASIGCVDTSSIERDGGDGIVTRLGQAVAKLPLGVRYAKMLLVAAQAGVLDYAIVMVAVLSESSPFEHGGIKESPQDEDDRESDDDNSLDEIDQHLEEKRKKRKPHRWHHKCGDIFAAMLATGAYSYAGRGAGGASEQMACRKFCEDNDLNYTIMTRIQKMRIHLAALAKNRLGSAQGVAAKTGGYSSKMTPPNKLQEKLLVQAIASGLLDNVAMLAPPGSINGTHTFTLRSAYVTSSSLKSEPMFIDRNSAVFSRDYRVLPKWICYDSVVRKTHKDGTPVRVMKNVTPIDPSWLGELSKGTNLISLGCPLDSPPPSYDKEKDAILCPVKTTFGKQGWDIPSVKIPMYDALHSPEGKNSHVFLSDDSFRWFARFLLEGKVLSELAEFSSLLNDSPSIITRKYPTGKVSMVVSALSSAGVDSASALRKHWAENDDKFLFKCLKIWVKKDCQKQAKTMWIEAVKQNIAFWKSR